MSPKPRSSAGTTRTCPHCRSTILESATMCPSCRHYLRFDPTAQTRQKEQATVQPLRIEGTVRHTAGGESWEYSVVVSITNQNGEEVARHVVGVGALPPDELRHFALAVEVFVPDDVARPADRSA